MNSTSLPLPNIIYQSNSASKPGPAVIQYTVFDRQTYIALGPIRQLCEQFDGAGNYHTLAKARNMWGQLQVEHCSHADLAKVAVKKNIFSL